MTDQSWKIPYSYKNNTYLLLSPVADATRYIIFSPANSLCKCVHVYVGKEEVWQVSTLYFDLFNLSVNS